MRTSTTSAATDVGRVRDHNEDFFIADDAQGIYAVADGVGGHQAGEIASRAAVEAAQAAAAQALAALPRPCSPEELVAVARDAVQHACEVVHELARPQMPHAGASTTLTLLLVDHNHAALAHVGDSRLYLVRGEHVEQLSIDHTVPNDMLRAGLITPEQALKHPFRHVLSRSLGSQRSVMVDTLRVDLCPGDVLLLASDGLNPAVDETALIREVATEPDLSAGAERLIACANELGGRDNATAVLIRIDRAAASVRASAVELLVALPLFSGLDLAGRSRVVGAGSIVELAAGAELAAQGAKIDGLWLVVEGRIGWDDGREPLELERGAWFGEVALVGPRESPAALVAKEPSRLFHLPARGLAKLSHRRPLLGVAILSKLAKTLAKTRPITPRSALGVPAERSAGTDTTPP